MSGLINIYNVLLTRCGPSQTFNGQDKQMKLFRGRNTSGSLVSGGQFNKTKLRVEISGNSYKIYRSKDSLNSWRRKCLVKFKIQTPRLRQHPNPFPSSHTYSLILLPDWSLAFVSVFYLDRSWAGEPLSVCFHWTSTESETLKMPLWLQMILTVNSTTPQRVSNGKGWDGIFLLH